MQQKNEEFAAALRRFGNGTRMAGWRLPAIDTYPRLIAFTQTFGGKLVLFALFGFIMKLLGGDLRMVIAAAVVSISGRYRYLTAMLCTGAILALNPQWFDYRAVYIVARHEAVTDLLYINHVRIVTLLASVPLVVTLLWLTRRFRHHPIGRRPVLASHLVLLCLLALSASNLLHGNPQVALWSITAVYAAYFWFLAYALIDQRRKQPAPLSLQLATFHPFFGSSTAPLGKSADNWRSVEAQTPQELAVTQLKGLKLIVWAYFLSLVLMAYIYIVHKKLGIVPLEIAFERFVQNGVSPGPSGILGIITNFFGQVLHLTIWGHSVVAVGRLAGFRLLRNTWRPLSSRTIAEFWNRYYYYFKELLVHVYFYPSYVRYFKRYPRLRIAFATFMAAGVGNWLFHFLLENYRIARDGIGGTLAYMQTYAFYCLLLATGIVISQLRGKRPPSDAGWLRGRLLPSLSVVTFYCMLSFFDGPQRHAPLKVHLAFLFHVFGF
jgi:hypothetical protein